MTDGSRNASRDRTTRCWLPAHRSTGLSADIPGLEETGDLREGCFADVVASDPERFAPRAGYVHPRELSRGVEYLPVKGRLAIADGKLTGIAAGRAVSTLPRPAPVHDASAPTGAGRIHSGQPT